MSKYVITHADDQYEVLGVAHSDDQLRSVLADAAQELSDSGRPYNELSVYTLTNIGVVADYRVTGLQVTGLPTPVKKRNAKSKAKR